MITVLRPSPEPSVHPLGDAAWLEAVLACSECREQRLQWMENQSRCPHIDQHFALREGIICPAGWHEPAHVRGQRKVWASLEKVRGTYDLPVEKLLRLPEEGDTQALLDWLRTLLRGKGPLRILILNARRGWTARALAEDGHQVVACDILDDPYIGLGCAVRLRAETGQPFACICANPTALPFRPETFDCVFGFELLRQTPDLELVFREISRVLRPGGLFLALQEPFRGALTTQTERLLDTPLYRLARWWLPGTLPRTTPSEIRDLRSKLGATLHGICRRVPFCVAQGEAAGLQTTVLPAAVVLSLSARLDSLAPAVENRPAWLASLARVYGLDIERLQSFIDLTRQTLGYDLLPELLSHWNLVGNIDGVLMARKGGRELQSFPALPDMDPERARRLDRLLLACSSDGFLPIFGVHAVQAEEQERYCWLMPRAGLLVPASAALEMTISCPARPILDNPVRIEFRLEAERLPIAIVLVRAGKKVTLKLPIPPTAARHDSIFLRITTNFGFLPSDFNSAPGCDTRLLAVKLQAVRADRAPATDLETILRQAIKN